MTAQDFASATYGTKAITGTDAVTGSFAGFYAPVDTVIASITIDGTTYADPATYFGSATVAATSLISIGGYTNGIFCTSITLTSGSLVAIKGA